MTNNKNNNNYSKSAVYVFVAMLAVFVYITVFAPKDMSAVKKENRELKKMPELNSQTVLSGEFSKGFEDYLADNVGYRSKFMDASSRIETAKGIKPKSGKVVTAAKNLGTGTSGENHLLVLSDRVMEVYREDENAKKAYAETIKRYSEELGDTNVYLMLAPTQIEFSKSAKMSDSEKETIDYIYGNVGERVKTVDVYSRLKAHKDEYIYFRTDHHWTQRGAFYAYSAFCSDILGEKRNIKDYSVHKEEKFLGYLYNQANDPSLASHSDTIEVYEYGKNYPVYAHAKNENGKIEDYTPHMYQFPANGETTAYKIFMGGDHMFAEINTDNKNGKTLLVIKDSYANALIPLLTRDYERILVIDPRSTYVSVSELKTRYDITDCMIVNYVFTTTFSDFVQSMNDVLK